MKTILKKIFERTPKRPFYCAKCGELKRSNYCAHCQEETPKLFKINLHDKATAKESLGIKQTRGTSKRYIKKIFSGYQSSGDKERHPRGVERYMFLDRENDLYKETVKDIKTGRIFRNIQEPLSQHLPNRQKRKTPIKQSLKKNWGE